MSRICARLRSKIRIERVSASPKSNTKCITVIDLCPSTRKVAQSEEAGVSRPLIQNSLKTVTVCVNIAVFHTYSFPFLASLFFLLSLPSRNSLFSSSVSRINGGISFG